MLRLLAAVIVAVVIFSSWERFFGAGDGCRTVVYPARCGGAVIGNRCHGELGEALPRRTFQVDPAKQRVVEQGGAGSEAHPRCRVTDCRHWECLDEVFVRTVQNGDFREELRPGLTAVDPRWTPTVAYVTAWKWWQLRAVAIAQDSIARSWRH